MISSHIQHLGSCPLSKFETSKLKPISKRVYKFGVSACYSKPIKNYYNHDQDWVYDLMVRNITPYSMIRYKGAQWSIYAICVFTLIYLSNGVINHLIK